MNDADPWVLLPALQELDGLVGGVVDDDDFVVLVVEGGARLQQPVDDTLLVVERELDGNEGLLVGGQTDLTHPLPRVVDLDRSTLAQVLAA